MRGESWRRAARARRHRERTALLSAHASRSSRALHRALRLALPLLASLALLLGWGLAAATLSTTPVARASANVPISFIIPAPDDNGNARGPVGAYVTINVHNLNASDAYLIGVGIASAGCNSQYIPATTEPRAPQADGSLTTTFIWPSGANAVGSSYYVCLQDNNLQGSQPFQSAGTYTVLAGSAPSISIAPGQPTGNSGTPGPIPPQGGNTYYAGSQITITGASFVPGGQPLVAYLLDHQVNAPSDFQAATPLSTTDNSTITADNNGGFTATVQLPQSSGFQSGKFYVYVLSQDAQTNFYPSLIAVKSIHLVPQPAPTPTVTVAPPTPTVNVTPTVTPGNGSGGPNNLGAVIGLGVTSVLLFTIGVILLASAAGMQRPPRP